MRHDDGESIPLLPPKSKSRQELPAGGGVDGERHNHLYRGVQWEALMPRLARSTIIPGLLGVVVAVTLAAAVISYFTQGGSSSSSINNRVHGELLVHPTTTTTHEAPTSLAVGGNNAILQGEGGSIPPSSSLIGDEVEERRSSRGGDDNGVKQGSSRPVGGDGGGDSVGVKQSEQADAEERRSPNVIFILIDDVGMNDMGATSTDLSAVTPFMQSLAEEGVLLSRYYTNHLCTPARSSLMTGRDTFRTGMQNEELLPAMPWGLPLDEVTLAERFKSAGYSTHMAGKWNLGMFKESCYPFNRGFDTFLGFMGPEETYYTHKEVLDFTFEGGGTATFNDFGFGDKDGYIDWTTNTTRRGPELEGKYGTSLTADRAIEVANELQAANEADGTDVPLFLYLAFQAAHTPLDVPVESVFTEEQLENVKLVASEEPIRSTFAKIIYYLDITIERLLNELDVMGMMDNTLVVLASDNGGCPSAGGSNFPYRGFKHTLFEGGVRTPALVYSKSDSIIPEEARGTRYDGMMHAVDWTPTLANVTGIPTVEMGKELSGFDQWSAIIGDRLESLPPVRNEVVLGRNSYVFDDDSVAMLKTTTPTGAYIYDGWKINIGDKCLGWFSFNPTDNWLADPQCYVEGCPTCADRCIYGNSYLNNFLFHIETDPYEKYNLLETMPDKFEEMVQRWNEATVDEVKPNYLPDEPLAVETWRKFNNWTVAWK